MNKPLLAALLLTAPGLCWADPPAATPGQDQDHIVAAAVPPAPWKYDPVQDEKFFTPFFDFSLSEAVYVPTNQNTFFSGGNMKADVGALLTLDRTPLFRSLPGNHALFGVYSFGYDGPGFQPQDQGEYQYRDLSHNFSLEYRWKFLGPLRVRPGVGYTKGYVRTGANETWGNGLYDSKSVGGQLALDYLIPHGQVTAQALYRKVTYPNLVDLLSEFQGAGVAANTNGGLQDNNLMEYSVSLAYKKLFVDVKYGTQDFLNEKVVDITGPTAGSYGNTAQKAHTWSGDLGFVGKLWRFEIRPKATVSQYTSNQNYLDFKFLGDPSPSAYVDWYSYTEIRGDLPLFLNLTEGGTAIFGDVSVVQRNYKDRVARDTNDVSKGEVEHNLMVNLTGGLRFRINEVSFMKWYVGVVNASSNNTFERYLPYNYTGTLGGIAFEMAY
jgi:hypothetical protein